MQKFTYDFFDNLESPTFVLSNVYHHHIGVINNIDPTSISINFNMNSQQEVSCDVYKEVDGKLCDLWDKITSLRYVFIPEHKEYYKIDVSIDDSYNTVKHLTLSSAGEYELSNKTIRSLEINTESDILRNENGDADIPTYAPNVLYNPTDPGNSILHRALADKAPDWSIKHVDDSIATIQRTFSVANQKIYNFFTDTLSKEYDCLFQFDSVNRAISVYDLLNQCEDCGERGEFTDVCTECGSTHIHKGYGKDTGIFITYNNYSEKVSLDGDEAAVKNCFYVTGGDDIVNAAIRNINPSGVNYIYNFSQADYDDMPQELIDKLEAYNKQYQKLLPKYQDIVEQWYNAVNDYYYYKTAMMPRINGTLWEKNKGYSVGNTVYTKTLPSWCYLECSKSGISGNKEFDTTGVIEGQKFKDGSVTWTAKKHIISIPSAEQSYNSIVKYFKSNKIYFVNSVPTAITNINNEVKNVAQLAINNLFRVEIVIDAKNTYSNNKWYGNIKVYNTGKEDDIYISKTPITVKVGVVETLEEYTKYMETKVKKRLNRSDTTFENVFEIKDDTEFRQALTQYGLDSLSSFAKSYQGCLDVLISNGIKDPNSKYMNWNVYDPIYKPYYKRLKWIESEITKREKTVKALEQTRDNLREQMLSYNKLMNLETYIGEDLLKTFYAYIREDDYNNANYISTGLSDGEIINHAKTLLKLGQKDLLKACELQVTLSDTVKNLFNTTEFKDYKDKLNIGDYIICEVDGDDWEDGVTNSGLYRLRLIGVSFNYQSPSDMSFTFANFTKVQNYFSDAQSVISSAQSISGSYNAVMHQVEKNTDVTTTVTDWAVNGLANSRSIIANNNNEEILIDEHGLYAREYDDVTDTYSEEQFRLTHNILEFTSDGWETSSLALGKNTYQYFDDNRELVTGEDYGLTAKFVNSGYIWGGQIVGSEIFSTNYRVANPLQSITADGSYINLDDGSFSLGGGGLYGYRQSNGTYKLSFSGSTSGIADITIGSWVGVWQVQDDGLYSGSSVLKPNNIYVTNNVRAADFIISTNNSTKSVKTTLTNLEDAVSSKISDVVINNHSVVSDGVAEFELVAGDNITITRDGNEFTISSTGGGGGGSGTRQYYITEGTSSNSTITATGTVD